MVSDRQRLQLLSRAVKNIDAKRRPKQPGIGFTDRFQFRALQRKTHDFREFVHELPQVEPWAIPLQNGKLGIVQPPGLTIPERLADLIDRPGARGQQAFHAHFRGGLQVEVGALRENRTGISGHDRLQRRISTRAAARQGGFHLKHACCGEIATQLGQHGGTGTQRVNDPHPVASPRWVDVYSSLTRLT